MTARRLWPAAVIGLVGLLAACAEPTGNDPTVDATGMPNAELALQHSLDQVDAAMRDLGGMTVGSRATAPAAAPSAGAPVVPAELQRPQSFTWSGPIDVGAKTLADRIGYRLLVTAPPGAVPVIVAVNLADVPALDLFKALGAAAGTQATVLVDPDHHQVEVQHHV